MSELKNWKSISKEQLFTEALERGFAEEANEFLNYFDTVSIYDAVDGNYFNVMKYLIEHDVEIHEDTLNFAVQLENLEALKILLEHGVKAGGYEVDLAISIGNIEILKLLLKYGAEISEYAVNEVVSDGNLEVLKLLLEHGAEISDSHIETAISGGHLEVIKLLLEHGGKVSERAVSNAILGGHLEILKFLLEHGAEIGASKVETAILSGHLEILKFLLEHGAEITGNGIELAAVVGHLEVIKFLLEHGDKVSEHAVTNAILGGHLEVLKFLLKHGGKISDSAVEVAVKMGHLEVLKFLLEHGSKITDKEIDLAAFLGNLDVLKLLIEYGDKISEYAVSNAASGGHSEVIKFLLEHGAEVGNNAIEKAAYGNHPEVVKFLVEYGVQVRSHDLLAIIKIGDKILIKHVLENLTNSLILPQENEEILFALYGDSELLKIMVKVSEIPSEELNKIYINAIIKGNYDFAAKLHDVLDVCFETNILSDISSAIIKGLDNSIENNKYHAIVNLIDKAGINIPHQYKHLVNNINDDIDSKEFDFIYGLTHKLAQHYINLAKVALEKSLLSQIINENEINQAKTILNEVFNADNQARFESFQELKRTFPNDNELSKVINEFDAYHMVIGNALNRLDKDFTLEVLGLNGVSVPVFDEDIMVYRGFVADLDDGSEDILFKYGSRAFGKGEMQKTLGFHVKEAWNRLEAKDGHFWQYGGTYVSAEPSMASEFALGITSKGKGENILLEIKLKAEAPKICGRVTHEYEFVPNNIEGSEIVAVYKLNNEKTIKSVYKNPYLQDTSLTPRYVVGNTIEEDKEAIQKYNSLDCKRTEYDDYNDFLTKYSYTEEMLKPFFKGRPVYEEVITAEQAEPEFECDLTLQCC
ncbi:ankyrin repeat domain-containing protein [Candidatus Jidaibacter acanthamoebae]|nr:ankyrin repeat domain-containing protein [Candidatus Jidaibacter acanthamoeba]